MNSYVNEVSQDGPTAETEAAFESPFLDRYEAANMEGQGSETSVASSVWQQLETPFLSQAEQESLEGECPQNQFYAQLLSELHDEEFDEVISDLVHEASAVYEGHLSQEYADSPLQREAAQQAVRDYLEPLVQQTEELLEAIGQEIGDSEMNEMSEEKLDEWFENFELQRTDLSPAFEGFLKGIWKKVKSVAKSVGKIAGNIAQKGLKVAAAIGTGGLSLILPKIKKLVRPLLRRVLRVAIGRLPQGLRPAATLLAKKLFGTGEVADQGEDGREEMTGEITSEDIQRELDVHIANSLTADTAEQSDEAIAEYGEEEAIAAENEYDVLQNARARFVGRITELQEGGDVRPAMEEFIPAILPALKIGISLIGRPRVVNFLAKLLAKLVARFVGPDMAGSLSRAIVNTGLKMIALEVTEQSEAKMAGHAIAATVEETVQQIAALPESVFEDNEMLEAYALEAFEQAAAANFPAEMIRPEIRESSVNGTWVLMPVNSPRKFYKKFTVVFEKVISPHMASNIRTFRGISLQTALRDQLNLDPSREFKARIHLYEAIPGTWLSRISVMERNVRGLGSSSHAVWSQLHPLTREAAAALLGEPGLGRDVSGRFLENRNLVGAGERFYYLEIEGVHAVMHPNQRRKRSSRVHVKLDCLSNRIIVALFLSEFDAQNIAAKLRQNAPAPIIVRCFTALLNSIRRNFSHRQHVRVVHEAVAMEEYRNVFRAFPRGTGGTRKSYGRLNRAPIMPAAPMTGRPQISVPETLTPLISDRIIAWSAAKISMYFRERKEEFLKATENPADGVTIFITFANPSLIPMVCRSLRVGMQVPASPVISRAVPSSMITIYPGLRRG